MTAGSFGVVVRSSTIKEIHDFMCLIFVLGSFCKACCTFYFIILSLMNTTFVRIVAGNGSTYTYIFAKKMLRVNWVLDSILEFIFFLVLFHN